MAADDPAAGPAQAGAPVPAAGGGPLVVVCLRHAAARPDVDLLTGAVRPPVHGAGPAPAELAALELGLRFAAVWHGEVLAVTAGPSAAEATLRDALAAGAAEVLRVAWPEADYLDGLAADEQALAAALAGALRPRRPALVLCGDRSADRGTGALPAFLAHELGAAQALGLVSLALPGDVSGSPAANPGVGQRDPVTGDPSAAAAGPEVTQRDPEADDESAVTAGQGAAGPATSGGRAAGGSGLAQEDPEAGRLGLVGERRLPGGWRERLWIGLPAVCSVEAAGISLRRAPLDAMLASRRAGIPVVRPAAATAGSRDRLIAGPPRPYRPRTREVPAAPAGPARERLAELSGVLVQRDPPTLLGPATPEEAAAALLDFLRKTGPGEGPGEPRS
jgi:electron transfer flavoprotein beta subunit